nr:unnamed protein product [Callosobruchus chinensis]
MLTNGLPACSIYILTLLACSCYAVIQNDFRFISSQDLKSSVTIFSSEGNTSYSQILFDVSRNQLFLSVRDGLYRLSLSGLKFLEYADWQSPENKRLECTYKGQNEENCHNYIKVLLSNRRHVFVCGTNAFSPQCSWREINNISNVIELVDGIAKSPYNPAANITAFLSENGEYYFGGPTDFSGSDSLISKTARNMTLRTKQYNSFWLNEPQFIGSFESEKFVYFLFRETAVEHMNCGKTIYSRIARVCKNDYGGIHAIFKDNWTTFLKARLNCSTSGEYPFYFNEIQSMSYVSTEHILYATFTTAPNSIAGSAVCSFHLSAIDAAFNGPFKYQHDMNSAWVKHDNMHLGHYNCMSTLRNNHLLETSKYQLMDSAVQSTSLDPLYTSTLERLTHITVDVIETKKDLVHVLYIATTEGLVKKLSLSPLHGKHTKPCIVEVWQVAPSIFNMKFLKETSSVYITTEEGLVQIPAAHCKRHSSRANCKNAMDPYCGWNEREESCSVAPFGDPHNRFWIQHVSSCPILDAPIDGGWSTWSDWSSCHHKTSPNSDSFDQCLCQTRQCNNPPPSNGGKPCSGPSIAVSNCTVHGGWSDWSVWSACSATCGTAVKIRLRTCTNPAPAFGGRVCVGQDRLEAYCTEHPPCPAEAVDGGWSPWSPWSSCSTNCGEGYEIRQRKCNNPAPLNGGQYCKGNDVEYNVCRNDSCPEQRRLHTTEWIIMKNTSSKYLKKRFKITCRAPVKHAHQLKLSIRNETQYCYGQQCDSDDLVEYSDWGAWSRWSDCSASCGGGIQTRTRHCVQHNCEGEALQTRNVTSTIVGVIGAAGRNGPPAMLPVVGAHGPEAGPVWGKAVKEMLLKCRLARTKLANLL